MERPNDKSTGPLKGVMMESYGIQSGPIDRDKVEQACVNNVLGQQGLTASRRSIPYLEQSITKGIDVLDPTDVSSSVRANSITSFTCAGCTKCGKSRLSLSLFPNTSVKSQIRSL